MLLTVGADGWPHAAFTWVGAPNPARLRVIADEGSTTLANLQARGSAAAQVMGPDDLLYLIKGTARVRTESQGTMPAGLKVVLAELAVEDVRDQRWAAVAVTPLGYRWKDAHMVEVERDVLRILTAPD
jgi:hypothetical protein